MQETCISGSKQMRNLAALENLNDTGETTLCFPSTPLLNSTQSSQLFDHEIPNKPLGEG